MTEFGPIPMHHFSGASTVSRNDHNNNNDNNTRFVERRGASEALADRSSQLASNRREKMSF